MAVSVILGLPGLNQLRIGGLVGPGGRNYLRMPVESARVSKTVGFVKKVHAVVQNSKNPAKSSVNAESKSRKNSGVNNVSAARTPVKREKRHYARDHEVCRPQLSRFRERDQSDWDRQSCATGFMWRSRVFLHDPVVNYSDNRCGVTGINSRMKYGRY